MKIEEENQLKRLVKGESITMLYDIEVLRAVEDYMRKKLLLGVNVLIRNGAMELTPVVPKLKTELEHILNEPIVKWPKPTYKQLNTEYNKFKRKN